MQRQTSLLHEGANERAPMRVLVSRGGLRVLLSVLCYAAAAAVLLVQVMAYDWKLDDAYITFAYARNWVEGHGIVFNIGERVEGYTCFLWVVLCALGLWLGFPIEPWSTALGTAFGVGTLWACAGLTKEFLPTERRFLAPVAALLLAAWPPFAWWSASGMETTLFAFLVTSTLWSYVRTEGRGLLSPVLLALAAMTRPEGWLLAALLSLDAVRLQGWRGARFGLTFAALFGPYFAWRVWYYGYLLPNTFYAKVGSTADQVARGVVYLKIFLLDWGTVLVVGAVASAMLLGIRRHAAVYAFLALYGAYVVAVGGDVFHFFRFRLPVVPTLLALASAATAVLFGRAQVLSDRLAVVAVVGVTLAWCARSSAVDVQAHQRHRQAANGSNALGKSLCACLLEHTRPGDKIAGLGIGVLKYCTNRHVVDMLGLTDLHIARHAKVPMGKGIAGHEKYDSKYVLSLRPKYILVPELDPKGMSLPAQRDMWAQPEFLRLYRKDRCGYRRIDAE